MFRPTSLQKYLSLDDFEAAAQKYLPQSIGGMIAGGSETNFTRDRNKAAFLEWDFVPRVLVDTSMRSQKKKIFEFEYSHPFGICPMGVVGLAGFDADLSLAVAAHEGNVPMLLSGASTIPMEEIAEKAEGRWFQAYILADRNRIGSLLDRVERAGYRILVITVDVPVAANRENNVRNGFSLPLRPTSKLAWQGITHPRWVMETFLRTFLGRGTPFAENFDSVRGPPILSSTAQRDISRRDALSWDDIRWIRDHWKHKLVLKGVLAPADAELAHQVGSDGVIVSNHGGRQLNGAIATIDALPAIVAIAKRTNMTVMLDGGVRRGTDVLKALALGADFVFVGRPFVSAAAVGGLKGVKRAIELLNLEIDRNMAMLGQNSLENLSRSLVRARFEHPGTKH
jgi:L-lactate dehydrogenase (cytochrome)